MAEHLANIFGTEKDKVNCPFYFKTGACRHGDRCSRLHNKPTESQTVLLSHMYSNPAAMLDGEALGLAQQIDKETLENHFLDFFEEVFEELKSFGPLDEMHVCDNLSAHLVGNVYVKYRNEDDAMKCVTSLNGRFYAGRPIMAEFSPVTDFREASCRQFDTGKCTHGGYCNFMHLKDIPRDLRKKLFGTTRRWKRSSSRSKSPPRKRSPRRDDFGGSRGGGGGYRGGYGGGGGGGGGYRGRRERSRSRSPDGGHRRPYRDDGYGGGPDRDGGYRGGPDRGPRGGDRDRGRPHPYRREREAD